MSLESDALGKIDDVVNIWNTATNPCANLHRDRLLRLAIEPFDFSRQHSQIICAHNRKLRVDERGIRQ